MLRPMKRAAATIAALALLSGCDWLAPPPPPSASSTSGSGGAPATTSSGGDGGSGGGSSGTGSAIACLACEPVEETGKLQSAIEIEISGVVASLAHDGVYYVHNDSGDSARFFAVDVTGKALATFTVSGATAVDWEDLARGPCPTTAGTCVFLGDIGDNSGGGLR